MMINDGTVIVWRVSTIMHRLIRDLGTKIICETIPEKCFGIYVWLALEFPEKSEQVVNQSQAPPLNKKNTVPEV